MIAPDFQKGADGNPCAPLAVCIGVVNDFNAHEPHVGDTGVNALSVATNGNATTLIAAAPCITVTGTLIATTSSSLVQERLPVIRMSTCDLRVPLV